MQVLALDGWNPLDGLDMIKDPKRLCASKAHLPIILSDKDPDLGPWVADIKWQRA